MSIRALRLGATLYMPCTRTDLAARLFGPARIPGLRSVVLCLEDSVLERDMPVALMNLGLLLRLAAARDHGPSEPMIFVRPRDPATLARIRSCTARSWSRNRRISYGSHASRVSRVGISNWPSGIW
ncbi:MAG: citrate lyase, partial [Sphingomonas sp.]